jgi:hypothetical protein
MWCSQYLLNEIYRAAGSSSSPLGKRQRIEEEPGAPLRPKTKDARINVKNSKYLGAKLSTSFDELYGDPRIAWMIYQNPQPVADITIEEMYEKIREALQPRIKEETDLLSIIKTHIIIFKNSDIFKLDEFFYSTPPSDPPQIKKFTNLIMETIKKNAKTVLLEDAASNRNMYIMLYRWFNENDPDMSLYDDKTSYYNRYGFVRFHTDDLQAKRDNIDRRFRDYLKTDPELMLMKWYHTKHENFDLSDVRRFSPAEREILAKYTYKNNEDFLNTTMDQRRRDPSSEIIPEPTLEDVYAWCKSVLFSYYDNDVFERLDTQETLLNKIDLLEYKEIEIKLVDLINTHHIECDLSNDFIYDDEEMFHEFSKQGIPKEWLSINVENIFRLTWTAGPTEYQQWKHINDTKDFPKTAQDLFPVFVEIIKMFLIKPENFVQSNLSNSSRGSITIIDIPTLPS